MQHRNLFPSSIHYSREIESIEFPIGNSSIFAIHHTSRLLESQLIRINRINSHLVADTNFGRHQRRTAPPVDGVGETEVHYARKTCRLKCPTHIPRCFNGRFREHGWLCKEKGAESAEVIVHRRIKEVKHLTRDARPRCRLFRSFWFLFIHFKCVFPLCPPSLARAHAYLQLRSTFISFPRSSTATPAGKAGRRQSKCILTLHRRTRAKERRQEGKGKSRRWPTWKVISFLARWTSTSPFPACQKIRTALKIHRDT